MNITCYSGFSKKPNSTKQPTGGTQKSVVLKQPTSVLNPIFIIEGYNLSWNYIQWGVRYYFVDDIVIVHNNIAEYHCSTDVMATFKSDIGASIQYVTRSAYASDPAVMDEKYPTIADTDRTLTPLTSIASGMGLSGGTFPAGTYVLGLKSKTTSTGVAFYALTPSQFGDFCDYLYSDAWLDATDITKSLQKMLVDPFDYIISCNWYPFTISGDSQPIYFGFFDWTGQQMIRIPEDKRIKSVSHTANLPDHPQIARGTYLNAAPFTRLTLNLYSFGQCILDPNRFLDSRSITVLLNIDLFTGIGVCKVLASTGTIYQASATCSVPIQLSQVRDDLTKPIVNSAVIAGNIASSNVVGTTASIANAVKNAPPQIESIGAVGSVSCYYNNAPTIDSIFYKIVDEDLAQIGRPLCKPRTISSLPGFIQCDNADLDTGASPAEKDTIISYLNSGFYYE